MSKFNFLTFLVDETFRLNSATHQSLGDLERKLADYGISFLRGQFIPQIQMLRFATPMGQLDIPINWSCFALEHGQDFSWVQTTNDNDGLLSIMKASWQSQIKSLLITQSQGYCYIIGLKENDEFYLQDLTNPQEILLKVA